MQFLEFISLALDVLLVFAAVIAYLTRPRIGGELAKGLRVLLVGVMILGFAHLFETIVFMIFPGIDTQLNEVIHRLLNGVGFGFIVLGFWTMRQAFEA